MSGAVTSVICCGISNLQEDQTKLSFGLRISVVVLGIIAMFIGVLILLDMPGLSFGTIAGVITSWAGMVCTLLATSIKCVKRHSNNKLTT